MTPDHCPKYHRTWLLFYLCYSLSFQSLPYPTFVSPIISRCPGYDMLNPYCSMSKLLHPIDLHTNKLMVTLRHEERMVRFRKWLMLGLNWTQTPVSSCVWPFTQHPSLGTFCPLTFEAKLKPCVGLPEPKVYTSCVWMRYLWENSIWQEGNVNMTLPMIGFPFMVGLQLVRIRGTIPGKTS